MFTFSDCNITLRSFGVYPTLGTFVLSASGGGEKTFDSLGLLEAETKIPTIKSPLTNNNAKHNLAFLEERGRPDNCITTGGKETASRDNYRPLLSPLEVGNSEGSPGVIT